MEGWAESSSGTASAVYPLHRITGTADRARIAASASAPSITGIIRSSSTSRTRSAFASNRSTNSCPLVAVSTSNPICRSNNSPTFSTVGSSSATSATPRDAPCGAGFVRGAGGGTMPPWRAAGRGTCGVFAMSAATSAGAGAAAETGASAAAGSRTVNRVPTPGRLSTRTPPPWPRMMPSTADRPSPRPANLVVKNGSNSLARVASSIPHPVSATTTSTNRPGAAGLYTPPLTASISNACPVVVTVTVPARSPMASPALMMRFISTCRIWPSSPVIAGSAPARSRFSCTFFGSVSRSSSVVWVMRPLRSMARSRNRPLPEYASSCRVSPPAWATPLMTVARWSRAGCPAGSAVTASSA